MGEHAAALEAACTAISDLAAAPAVVRPAALDGDGVRAKNQLEMAGIDLLSALDATGKARRESDLAAPASGDVGATVQGPARVRGAALDGAPIGAAAELPSPRRARREPGDGDRAPRGRGQEELFSIQDAVRVHRG